MQFCTRHKQNNPEDPDDPVDYWRLLWRDCGRPNRIPIRRSRNSHQNASWLLWIFERKWWEVWRKLPLTGKIHLRISTSCKVLVEEIHHHIEKRLGIWTIFQWQLLVEKNWCDRKGVFDHLRWLLLCRWRQRSSEESSLQYWKTFQYHPQWKHWRFIGCNIESEWKQILLSQADLIKKMITKLESKIKNTMRYKTLAPASTHIVRCSNEEEGLTKEEQKEIRSGVGSLLYLFKDSRPELSNSVRELTKVMDRAKKALEKSLYRDIRFVKETKQRWLVLEPKRNELTWGLKGYSDSDFAGDTDTTKSVSGFVIYLCGPVIAWRSKGQ